MNDRPIRLGDFIRRGRASFLCAIMGLAHVGPVAAAEGARAEPPQQPAAGNPIRVGIIGLDAHAVPWTQIIQGPKAQPPMTDMRIVAAYPAFSADIPFSSTNIQKNIETMRKLGVEISPSIDAMLARVDAVLLLSIDGRPHLEQARAVFKTRKPLFVDKPVASSLADIILFFREADQSGTPCFSNSSLRYGSLVAGMVNDPKVGPILGCTAYSNGKSILPDHPELFYYGIHGCEILFTIMGPGCKTVACAKGRTAQVATGVWADGRIGTLRGILEGPVGFGATVFGQKSTAVVDKFEGYEPLLVEIARFFKTRKPPMTVEKTIEIYAFLEGADESLKQGGKPVALDAVIENARKKAGG
ncbi:MAG TPA: Gfo/Idh/MocA family oxidoreductase [Verrucomicrobiae bacterium]|mgnify:CR=1 FL=1|nr:Gfo/Idh/MocA family oxidoreductase [Verrucomicrobiae bacterium]